MCQKKRIKTPGIVVWLRGNKLLVRFHYFSCVKELHQGINVFVLFDFLSFYLNDRMN